MHISILTFEGFNELDSFIAYGILNRVRLEGWRVTIASPSERPCSMNGLVVDRQATLAQACSADAVLIGSGLQTRQIAENDGLMAQLALDPARQLVAAQCSGALLLARLGVLEGVPACTDLTTCPWLVDAGVDVLEQPFYQQGNIATAGGCLASVYLAAWLVWRLAGQAAVEQAVHYVAPVGEKTDFVEQVLCRIQSVG
ncbi:glutamine amidotransferase [Halopseudomonas oceani]|uniref:AraC family transcriptional regulator n=1 Tax=Halopseudomonas oceani TaxID=1708783 RepID=A0A2P4ETG4_9GAMM|nr:DJ-1/PfpI family protein [Halopseudomonas oceani]POB02580.1 AraC family transcriptional regulator [Halopseudomonas oceani]GGE52533.1 glutamine amidotransferase [Halopseudomonas oceani]